MGQRPRRVFVGLGANLGNPCRTLQRAISRLGRLHGLFPVALSGHYETAPWGGQTDTPFINAVAELSSDLDPDSLLDALTSIEFGLGRRRSEESRWGDRCVDLDLLAAGSLQVSRPGLQLPHPRLAQRRFVLVPWAEIAPDFLVPGHPGSVAELLSRCRDPGQVQRMISSTCS